MSSSTQLMDELVKEYLLFRGFTSAVRALSEELKCDKDKSFRPDKIVDQFTSFITLYDLNGLRDLWNHFDSMVFEKLEQHFMPGVKKLENALLRMYIVNAVVNGKQDKVNEFFEKLGPELQNQAEWKDWFSIPFIKNPEENPLFALYFTRQWQDTMLISLHNLLAVSFQCLPQPKLMAFNEEASRITSLQSEIDRLKLRLARTAFTDSQESTALPSDGLPPGLDLVDDFYLIPASDASPADNSSRSFRNFIRGFGGSNGAGSLNTSPLSNRRVSPSPMSRI